MFAERENQFIMNRRYQVRVVSHVTRMVGSREDALDLAQEVFLKVFQALERFNPAYKFSTWLFRIAGNAAIDHLRKRRPRTVPLESPDPEGSAVPYPAEQRSNWLDPYGELRNTERGQAIHRAIQDLPPAPLPDSAPPVPVPTATHSLPNRSTTCAGSAPEMDSGP